MEIDAEHRAAGEPQQRRCACCCGPLSAGVGRQLSSSGRGWNDSDMASRLSRRTALRITGCLISAALMPARGQQGGKVPAIGAFLVPSSYFRVFEETLRELGYAKGKNIEFQISPIERQFFPQHLTTELETQYAAKVVPEAAAAVVSMNVDVIVVGPNPFIDALKQATTRIPIVMAFGLDPVGQGYIESFSHPGRNITGLAWETTPEIFGKLVEVLIEMSPRLSRIAGLVDPGSFQRPLWEGAETAAKRRGVVLRSVEIHSKDDITNAFANVKRMRAGAIMIFTGPKLWIWRDRIVDLAMKDKLPTVFPYREGPESGALISYGPNLAAAWRQVAAYVDKILKGANPGQLPVVQSAEFELVVNLKTAMALRISIPESIRLRADLIDR